MLVRALALAALVSASSLGSHAVTPAAAQVEQDAISSCRADAGDRARRGLHPVRRHHRGLARRAGVWLRRHVDGGMGGGGARGRSTPAPCTPPWPDRSTASSPPRTRRCSPTSSAPTFGRRMTALERGVQMLGPSAQIAARAEGQALIDAMEPGSARAGQLDEMLALVNADIAAPWSANRCAAC